MFGRKKDDQTPQTPLTPEPKAKKSGWRKGMISLAFAGAVGGVGFFAGLPIMEATGVAFRVPANQRMAVTYYGGFNFPGYVADPGINFKLPGYHDEPVPYRVDQLSMDVNTEKNGNDPINIATNDNQRIINVVLTAQFTLAANRVEDIHTFGQDYDRIIKEQVLRVGKEVLGDINISKDITSVEDLVSGAQEQNLTAQRDSINTRLTALLAEAIAKTKLAGLVEVQGLQLTNFEFTREFTENTEEFSRAKNDIITEQANLRKVEIEAEQERARAAGERDAALARADGRAGAIEREGRARGIALESEVAPMNQPGAENLIELKRTEAWANGADVPEILTINNGDGGNGGTPGVILDGRNLVPILGNQQGRTNDTNAPAAAEPAPAPALGGPR